MSFSPATPFGRLVRHWRRILKKSQREVARAASISTRHLSFIETGRSQPSRDTVLAIARALEVTDEGAFLEAAGFLAPYAEIDWDDPEAKALRRELHRAVAQLPHPALVHDRFGTVLEQNGVLQGLVTRFAEAPAQHATSSGHHLLNALRPYITNWNELAEHYRGRLFRELVRGEDALADAQLEDLLRMWGSTVRSEDTIPSLFIPLSFRGGGLELHFDLLTATVGVPQDIVLRDFRLVILLPRDDATRAALRTD